MIGSVLVCVVAGLGWVVWVIGVGYCWGFVAGVGCCWGFVGGGWLWVCGDGEWWADCEGDQTKRE